MPLLAKRFCQIPWRDSRVLDRNTFVNCNSRICDTSRRHPIVHAILFPCCGSHIHLRCIRPIYVHGSAGQILLILIMLNQQAPCRGDISSPKNERSAWSRMGLVKAWTRKKQACKLFQNIRACILCLYALHAREAIQEVHVHMCSNRSFICSDFNQIFSRSLEFIRTYPHVIGV